MSLAQGTVSFFNTATTLVSAGAVGHSGVISGSPGSYYFGLLTAPPGTTDPGQFTFAAAYATNTGSPGRLAGGVPMVTGWLTDQTKSFLVAGWSASLGHDWNQEWMSGTFGAMGFFGLSSIGIGSAGGDEPPPAPPLPLFGPAFTSVINAGWNLDPVPEPSTVALVTLGAATLILQHHRSRTMSAIAPG
jgi:hypothetical protein